MTNRANYFVRTLLQHRDVSLDIALKGLQVSLAYFQVMYLNMEHILSTIEHIL